MKKEILFALITILPLSIFATDTKSDEDFNLSSGKTALQIFFGNSQMGIGGTLHLTSVLALAPSFWYNNRTSETPYFPGSNLVTEKTRYGLELPLQLNFRIHKRGWFSIVFGGSYGFGQDVLTYPPTSANSAITKPDVKFYSWFAGVGMQFALFPKLHIRGDLMVNSYKTTGALENSEGLNTLQNKLSVLFYFN